MNGRRRRDDSGQLRPPLPRQRQWSRSALKEINQAAAVYVSAIRAFEIAMRVSIGKLKLPDSPQGWFEKGFLAVFGGGDRAGEKPNPKSQNSNPKQTRLLQNLKGRAAARSRSPSPPALNQHALERGDGSPPSRGGTCPAAVWRQVAKRKSGDKSPHSKVGFRGRSSGTAFRPSPAG